MAFIKKKALFQLNSIEKHNTFVLNIIYFINFIIVL